MSAGRILKLGFGILIGVFIANLIAVFGYLQFFGDDKVEFVPTDISNPIKFKQESAFLEMKFLITAINDFKADLKRFPSNEENLKVLIHQPPGLNNWNGPYSPGEKIPLDPWGNPYGYNLIDEEHFKVLSFGADGKKGGTGADKDLIIDPFEDSGS